MSWVTSHQKPGRDTAGQADPNWPRKTRYSISCGIMLSSDWGS